MMRGGHGLTKLLLDLNWGVLNHASRAPQLRSCNSYLQTVYLPQIYKCNSDLSKYHPIPGSDGPDLYIQLRYINVGETHL